MSKISEITSEDLKLLDDFEFKQLRDFVRGKGRGSVSKLAFEDILNENFEEPELTSDLEAQEVPQMPQLPQLPQMPQGQADQNIVMFGNPFQMPQMQPNKMFQINFVQPPRRQRPKTSPKRKQVKSKPTTTERPRKEGKDSPSDEDFEELARILKLFRNSKPPKSQPPPALNRLRSHSNQLYKTIAHRRPLSTIRTTQKASYTHLPIPLPTPTPLPSPPPSLRSNPWSTQRQEQRHEPKIRQEGVSGFHRSEKTGLGNEFGAQKWHENESQSQKTHENQNHGLLEHLKPIRIQDFDSSRPINQLGSEKFGRDYQENHEFQQTRSLQPLDNSNFNQNPHQKTQENVDNHPKQGLPIIIEQEEPDFASFVVAQPSEADQKTKNTDLPNSWQGSVKPLAQSQANLPSDIVKWSSSDKKNDGRQSLEQGDGSRNDGILKSIDIKLRQELKSKEATELPFTIAPTEESSWLDTEGAIEPINPHADDWEDQMRELSRKLGSYLLSIKKKKEQKGLLEKTGYTISAKNLDLERSQIQHQGALVYTSSPTTTPVPTTTTVYRPPKAYVTILREGYVQENPSDYDFIASITLVRDEGKVILVDTGLATDINGRTDLIQKLHKLNIAPPMVDYVITTHGHPDHSGNTHEFPDSYHFQGNFMHYRTKFNFSSLYQNTPHTLTTNVFLIKTPGHTSNDITVMVRNTDKYGTIAITGDVFINVEDLDFPVTWQTLAWNETMQAKSRREVLCQADYIIPGHGKIFKVTNNMRGRVNCR